MDLEKYVHMRKWVPHEELPAVLNSLRLLVIPSFSEGLPNIMLEAMACGTPVLASRVGAIRDTIKDGENGFLIRDNAPISIAEGISRALSKSDIDSVVEKASSMIDQEFSFEKAVAKWRDI